MCAGQTCNSSERHFPNRMTTQPFSGALVLSLSPVTLRPSCQVANSLAGNFPRVFFLCGDRATLQVRSWPTLWRPYSLHLSSQVSGRNLVNLLFLPTYSWACCQTAHPLLEQVSSSSIKPVRQALAPMTGSRTAIADDLVLVATPAETRQWATALQLAGRAPVVVLQGVISPSCIPRPAAVHLPDLSVPHSISLTVWWFL